VQIIGIICLIVNCSSMAIYILLQKRFIFNGTGNLAKWAQHPIHITAWR
jgi:hypothetical protein